MRSKSMMTKNRLLRYVNKIITTKSILFLSNKVFQQIGTKNYKMHRKIPVFVKGMNDIFISAETPERGKSHFKYLIYKHCS